MSNQPTEDEPDEFVEPKTITMTFELDPARSVMLQSARSVGGEIPDNYIQEQLQKAVETVYDQRNQIAARVEQAAQDSTEAAPVDAESVATDGVGEL